MRYEYGGQLNILWRYCGGKRQISDKIKIRFLRKIKIRFLI